MAKIKDIKAYEILDSRGNPTVKALIILDNGITATASVPSGASKGTHEALELRDNDPLRYHGQGVLKSIDAIQNTIKPALTGMDPNGQREIDYKMIEVDGTENKSRLGANSILAVSLACARAASSSLSQSLYAYLATLFDKRKHTSFPTPMFNVINGGLHGCGKFNFQEFMIIPSQTYTYDKALQMGAELYYRLKKHLQEKELIYSVGDEGGFTPNLSGNEDVLRLLREVVNTSAYTYGKDVFVGLDFASSTYARDTLFELNKGEVSLAREKYREYLIKLAKEYDLSSLEDPLPEDDWDDWQKLTHEMGGRLIVGDDLLVTNIHRLEKGIEMKACNSILVKVNQIGTLTETLDVVKRAQESGFKIIISHRSGETIDHFIADLAVAVEAEYVKFGAPARGERVAKYNRLLEIYEARCSDCS